MFVKYKLPHQIPLSLATVKQQALKSNVSIKCVHRLIQNQSAVCGLSCFKSKLMTHFFTPKFNSINSLGNCEVLSFSGTCVTALYQTSNDNLRKSIEMEYVNENVFLSSK